MKKVLMILSIMIVVLALASCGHIHLPGEEIAIEQEPTCTKDGLGYIYCLECGEVAKIVVIPATGTHKVETIPAKEATCDMAGNTEGEHCAQCDKILVEPQIIPAKGHQEEVIPAVESTCTKTGLTEGKRCFVCNDVLVEQQEIPLIAHVYTDKYDESCNKCGFIRDAECAHKETQTIKGYSATCTSTGLSDGSKCKKCGEIIASQQVIPTKPHTEVIDKAVEATCTKIGLTEGKHCSVCGTILVGQKPVSTIECTESDWIVDVEATKSEDGKRHTVCTMCGKIIREETIPATGSEGLEFTLYGSYSGYGVTFRDCYGVSLGTCTDTDIVIPSTYNGLPVLIISSFSNCTFMKSITIPDSVKHIGGFSGCSSLESITIPNSVISMGEHLFDNCTALKSVVLSNSLTEIKPYTFYGCTSLESITIPDSVTSIGDDAFSFCTSLTSIEIPDSVTSIGDFAFYECSSLANVSLSKSISEIPNRIFWGCTSLTSINIPQSIRHIDYYAFYECDSLKNVYYDGDIEGWLGIVFDDSSSNPLSNGANLYLNNELLTTVTIPNSAHINNYAFYGCTSLISVTISDSITSIGFKAFNKCTSLQSVMIPNSVTNIRKYTFDGCPLLTIYAEADVKSDGWENGWNYNNAESKSIPVVWGYTGE